MLTQLNALAHNLLIWRRNWLAQGVNLSLSLAYFVWSATYCASMVLFFNPDQSIAILVLKYYDRFSYQLSLALRSLLEPWHIVVILDKV
jgi:hypothetical protein